MTNQKSDLGEQATGVERQALAIYFRKTPVGAVSSKVQNRLIQILERDAGLDYKPVSSIYEQVAPRTPPDHSYKFVLPAGQEDVSISTLNGVRPSYE